MVLMNIEEISGLILEKMKIGVDFFLFYGTMVTVKLL